jgi:hypothetical protein
MPSSFLPSSPAPFLSEVEYRSEAEEDDNAVAEIEADDSDDDDIDIFQDAER